MMEVPTVQKKSEQIFFVQPKVHQFNFADLNQMVPTDPLKLIAFFEQCQATNKMSCFSRRSPRTKTSRLPAARSHVLSYQQHCCHKYCDYHTCNQRNRGNIRPNYHHQDNQHHNCPCYNGKDLKSSKSYKKKDDCKHNNFKIKTTTRPCIITSPLCLVRAICMEEGVILAQDLLCTLVLCLALAQAAGATTITMWLRMTTSRARSQSVGTCKPPRVITTDISIALTRAIPFLPPSSLKQQRKVSAPGNRKLCQQRIHVFHCMSLFQIGNQLSD
jgi:hypothetical protein